MTAYAPEIGVVAREDWNLTTERHAVPAHIARKYTRELTSEGHAAPADVVV